MALSAGIFQIGVEWPLPTPRSCCYTPATPPPIVARAPPGLRPVALLHPFRTIDPVPPFKVHSDFAPAGDQPKAIEALADGVRRGDRFQTLLGITGSGKSATMAWTIEQVQRPTLVIAPNKSLAAQLANEFREFFPENRVEYFVSYYDYYQPEAYMPSSDTYIEKDSSVKDEIHPAYEEHAVRIELFGDDVERVTRVDTLTGEQLADIDDLTIFPATHYVA